MTGLHRRGRHGGRAGGHPGPLTKAIECLNLEAVAALLKAGADVASSLSMAQFIVAGDVRSSVSDIRYARRKLIPLLLRAGATISPSRHCRPLDRLMLNILRTDCPVLCGNQLESRVLWMSLRRWRREIFDVYTGPDTADVCIATAEELSTYLGNVHAAGGFAKYGQARRAPFVAMLDRVGAFPIPNEMIAIVCAFWLRAGEYYGGVDDPTPMHEATKENLLALIAESNDDEDAWADDLEEELFS